MKNSRLQASQGDCSAMEGKLQEALACITAKDAELHTKEERIKAMECSHIEALKVKDEAFNLKILSLSKELARANQKVQEHLAASKRVEADHAAAMELQASALEKEFQDRLCLKAEEFERLEEEYALDLAQRDSRLEELNARLVALHAGSHWKKRVLVSDSGVACLKMHTRDSYFSLLVSVVWPNCLRGVNYFTRLQNNTFYSGWEPITVMPRLTPRIFTNARESGTAKPRSFGFCFRGPAISIAHLRITGHIKEAYGETVDGLHYVCLVFFKRHSPGPELIPILPYAFGLIPATIQVELIPGRDYHLAAYMAGFPASDPVLDMIKRPSTSKWFWHSQLRVVEN